MISTTFIAILIIASVGYLVGRWRASRLTVEPGSKLHSQPSYHGVVKWGVTLPSDMQVQLTHFMNTADSGTLVITALGDVQLEQ